VPSATVRPAGRVSCGPEARSAGRATDGFVLDGFVRGATGPDGLDRGQVVGHHDGTLLGELAQHAAGLGRADAGGVEGRAQLLEGQASLGARTLDERLDDVGRTGGGGHSRLQDQG
jgi:hypothetical protein